tara:strand:+ start:244 stop:384 length:141 start_codon:yes stop_codon:yes gene_type:complete
MVRKWNDERNTMKDERKGVKIVKLLKIGLLHFLFSNKVTNNKHCTL